MPEEITTPTPEVTQQGIPILGASKGTPLPVDAKPEQPAPPRSTAKSILAARKAQRAEKQKNNPRKPEAK